MGRSEDTKPSPVVPPVQLPAEVGGVAGKTSVKASVEYEDEQEEDNVIQLFENIVIKDEKLRKALQTVPSARDDVMFRRETRETTMALLAPAVVATLIWYAIVGVFAYWYGGLSALGWFSGFAGITAIVPATLRKSSVGWLRKKLIGRHRAFSAIGFALSGPWLLTALISELVLTKIEKRHIVEGHDKYAVLRKSSTILADDRSAIIANLADALDRWERLIVRPNRHIAFVQSGLVERVQALEDYLQRLRAEEDKIRKLIKLSKMLLEIEGSLGDTLSSQREDDGMLREIEEVGMKLRKELHLLGVDQEKQEADDEVARLSTEEIARRFISD